MRHRSLFILLVFIFSVVTMAADGRGAQESYPNPHWAKDKKLCLQCHEKLPTDAGNLYLKFGSDYIALCNNCHAVISKDKYIHAVAMVPPDEQVERMPEDFKKAVQKDKEKRLTCVVCHELKYQCLESEYYRKETNPRFFRGGPYADRSDLCYHCHDISKYERLNPHEQITDEGDLMPERCLYCHDKTPDRKKVKSINDVKFKVDKELNRLCLRCHPAVVGKEGGEAIAHADKAPAHMVKPSGEVLSKMEKGATDYIVPLDPSTGKIFCGTCHNPHAIGVQRLTRADKGADAHGRLRMGETEKCASCHGADFKPVAPIVPEKHPVIK